MNCEWSEWTTTDCSETCGAGTRSKSRTITVMGAHGGDECNDDDATAVEDCNDGPCPGTVTSSY